MGTPAVVAALGGIAGVVIGRFADPERALAWLLAAFLLSLAGALLAYARTRSWTGPRLCAAGLAAAIGLWRASMAVWGLGPEHVVHRVEDGPQTVAVTGVVDEPPVTRVSLDPPLRWTSFVLRAQAVGTGRDRRAVSGRVRVFVWRRDDLPPLRYGDVLRLSGTLAPPRAPTNPGEFDWRVRSLETGVRAVLSVPRTGAVEVRGYGGGAALWRWAFALRERVHAALRAVAPGEHGALLASLLLGVRDGVTPAVRDRFAHAGLAHLLAISGLHLALLAAVVGLLLRRVLRLPALGSHLGVMAFAIFYCVLTGARPPVVRATVMLLLVVSGWILEREAHPLDALAIAALLLLGWRPLELFSVGFQLSFVAVIALVLLAGPLGRAFNAGLRKPGAREPWLRRTALLSLRATLRLVAASLVAWLATAPIAARVFHTFTPWAVLSNVACAVLFSALLGVGLLAVLCAPCGGWLAVVASAPALALCTVLTALLARLASLPGTPIYVADVSTAVVVSCYLALGIAAWVCGRGASEWPRRRRVLVATVALCFVPAALLVQRPRRAAPGSAYVSVLDVSAGAASVVEGPGAVALIDCGSSRLRMGQRLVAPALWRRGHRRIDHLVLSHAHRDHVNGVEELLERFAVGRVYVGPAFRLASRGRRLLRRIRERGVPIHVAAAGDRIPLGGGVWLEVLAPTRRPVWGEPARTPPARLLSAATSVRAAERSARWGRRVQNDASLVLRLHTAGGKVLFPGDIEERGTEDLLASGRGLAAEVLVLPHHGRRNRRSRALRAAVRPRLAIASNRRGWCDDATLCGYEDAGVEVRETGRGGAVLLELGPAGLRWESWCPSPAVR